VQLQDLFIMIVKLSANQSDTHQILGGEGIMSGLIAEGKTKSVEDAGNGEVFIRSKDDITAGDGAKRDMLDGKAACSTRTTCNMFELLERNGVYTHFISRIDDTTFRARNMQMIPIELVVRRIAVGSYLKRNPEIREGTFFGDLVFEMFEKDDAMHDPKLEFDFVSGTISRYVASKPKQEAFIDEELLVNSRYAEFTPELLRKLQDISLRTFSIIEQGWAKFGGTLYDFKIECGFDRETGELLVADVIDNDSWRLRFGDEQKDKQSYRDGSKPMSDIKKDYMDVATVTDCFV
jgi:phosphoribosylaminoimidazole-succinocarboxamide synthase